MSDGTVWATISDPGRLLGPHSEMLALEPALIRPRYGRMIREEVNPRLDLTDRFSQLGLVAVLSRGLWPEVLTSDEEASRAFMLSGARESPARRAEHTRRQTNHCHAIP